MEEPRSSITQLGGAGPLSEDEVEVLRHLTDLHSFDGTNFGPQAGAQANSFERVGQDLYDKQDPICAACFRLALRHYFHVEGPEGLRTLNCARSLGRCLRLTGELQVARDLLAEVLRLQTAMQGMEDEDALVTAHHLCVALLDLDQPDAAEDLLIPAIEMSSHLRGDDHPLTFILQSLLGDAHRIRGDFESALELLESAFKDLERTLGPADEETLTCMNNLAVVYYELGRLLDSERLQRNLHEVRLAAKGPDDPDTITALANLASTRYQLGEWSEALQMERQALRDRIRVQGEDHPDTWTAMNNLAGTLRMMGDVAEARELLEKVFEARRANLTTEHHETLTAEANLADLLRKSGDVDAAAALAEHVHAVRSTKHDDTHPALQEAKALLAAVRLAQGRLQDAIEIQTAVLKYRIATLGDIHIDTALARSAMARMLEQNGELDSALQLHQDALTFAEQAMGPQATDVLDLKMNLAEALHARGEDDAAKACALQAAEALAVRRAFYADDFSIALRAFALLAALNHGEPLRRLFADVSALMCSALELRTRTDIRTLLANFIGFHETWQAFCVERFPEDLPLALLPSQGIESSVEIATSLAHSGGTEWQTIVDLRKELLYVRGRIEQLDATLGAPGEVDETLRARHEQLISTERAAVRRYDDALERLAGATGEHSAALRLRPQTCDELVSALSDGEVLLLLWHHPRLGYIASAVGDQLRFDLRAAGLGHLHEEAGCYELQSAANRCYRSHYSSIDAVEAMKPVEAELLGPAITTERLRATCEDAFWTPLLIRLPPASKLLIVTGPRAHSLPLDIGNPGVGVRYFAGLPSYHAVRHVEMDTRLQALELITDSACDTRVPIPFVEAEARIVGTIVPGSAIRSPENWIRNDLHPASPRRALIACHGGVVGDGEYRFPVLVLDVHKRRYLGPAHIQSMGAAFAEFYCSACVGGIVSQTSAGDAFGIVSALQRRGVRSVVASSAPLPDFYMPLVSALYWYARCNGTDPQAALACAKTQLRTGDWPTTVIETVRDAYLRQIESILEHLAATASEASETGLALARTATGWLWPDSLSEASHVIGDHPDHVAFSRAYCESLDRRQQVAGCVTENLIAKRSALPRAAVDHICAFMVCYG